MPTRLELIYALLIAVAWPVYDYYIDWPRFLRRLREDPLRARLREYPSAILLQWLLVGVCVFLWLHAGRPWADLRIHIPMLLPRGWRLWGSCALLAMLAGLHIRNVIKLNGSARTRAQVRAQMKNVEPLLPRTGNELAGFVSLSVTAGVCEEFLFRGYLPWAVAPWLGWWGAAVFSVVAFGLVHAYQGSKGMIQAAILGSLMTVIVAVTHSLLPAMALHALIDIGSGLIAWIALREPVTEEQMLGGAV
jgi:uncharacterized protein